MQQKSAPVERVKVYQTHLEYAAMEDDYTVIFEKLNDLVIVAFVDVISISMLEVADCSDIFQDTDTVVLGLDELFEFFNL